MTTAHIGKPIRPRRRPRQGDRRGEVRRRVQRPGPRLRLGRLQRHRPGEDHRDRRERGARRCPGVIQVFTHENRPALRRGSTAATATRSRRPARRSARSTTPRSSSAPSRSPWSSPTRWSWRATRRRSSGSSTNAQPHATDLDAQRGDGVRSRTSRPASAAAEAARPRRQGPRRGRRAGRRRVPGARRAPQPDGDVRDDGRSGTRTASSPSTTRRRACRTSATTSASVFGFDQDELRVVSAVRRRGVRLGAAAAVPGLPGRAGRAAS